jgi:hypothetical protein
MDIIFDYDLEAQGRMPRFLGRGKRFSRFVRGTWRDERTIKIPPREAPVWSADCTGTPAVATIDYRASI